MTKALNNSTTLAIGDGANDVEMIKAADLGVGIIGKEGNQAGNNSDVAISKFKMLLPLLLVDGHNNYYRISKLIYFQLYKNILLTFCQYFYSFYAGFSGQKVYPEFGFQLFNIMYFILIFYSSFINRYSAIPIFIVSIAEEHFETDYLLKYPILYKPYI